MFLHDDGIKPRGFNDFPIIKMYKVLQKGIPPRFCSITRIHTAVRPQPSVKKRVNFIFSIYCIKICASYAKNFRKCILEATIWGVNDTT
jgi:hypothetical protein